jgi:hypothetical protein
MLYVYNGLVGAVDAPEAEASPAKLDLVRLMREEIRATPSDYLVLKVLCVISAVRHNSHFARASDGH